MTSTIKWRPLWKLWIPVVLFLVPLILERQMAGTTFTPYVYGLFILLFGILYYFRIRMWESIVLMASTSITILWYFIAARPGLTFDNFAMIGLEAGPETISWITSYLNPISWFGALIVNFVLTYTLGAKLVKALELEKNAIRLFKLTAKTVAGENNGFTGRPMHVGRHEVDKNTLHAFTAFLESKKICVAQYPGNGVKYIFSMGTSPLVTHKQDKLSHVFFGSNGELNVYISAEDYRQYSRKFSFDELCSMMGSTFLRFAEYLSAGYDKRILDELKAV